MTVRRPAGFTLVELTIVMVVLGIAAGLVIPALSSLLAREGEKSAARILMGALRRARTEAVLTGQPWQVAIDWNKGECTISPVPQPPQEVAAVAGSTAGKDTPAGRTPAASAQVDAAMTPKKTIPIPPVKLPAGTHPRLAIAHGESVEQPDVTTLAVRPEGLCQPAFFRLPGPSGTDVAVTVDAVGCRVVLATDDLDTRQAQFQKAQGLISPPWASVDYGTGGG